MRLFILISMELEKLQNETNSNIQTYASLCWFNVVIKQIISPVIYCTVVVFHVYWTFINYNLSFLAFPSCYKSRESRGIQFVESSLKLLLILNLSIQKKTWNRSSSMIFPDWILSRISTKKRSEPNPNIIFWGFLLSVKVLKGESLCKGLIDKMYFQTKKNYDFFHFVIDHQVSKATVRNCHLKLQWQTLQIDGKIWLKLICSYCL